MSTIVVHFDSFEVLLRAGPNLADVAWWLRQIVTASGVREGSLHIKTIGSTAQSSPLVPAPPAPVASAYRHGPYLRTPE
jgi:hypothetical protein